MIKILLTLYQTIVFVKDFLPAVEFAPVLIAGLVASLVPAEDTTVDAIVVEEGVSEVGADVDTTGEVAPVLTAVLGIFVMELSVVDCSAVPER